MRSERVTATAPEAEALASYAETLAALAAAEQADGWLVECMEARRFLALSAPFVDALAQALGRLDELPLLEICAGDGSLAAALGCRGIAVIATDRRPASRTKTAVERRAADDALRRYRARVVLGSFVPVDSPVDQQVLDASDVRHYVVLNARLGGQLGARCLWTRPGWRRRPLEQVTRWMICRHDVWLGPNRPPLTHGEAWLLSRTEERSANAVP
ncbi:MAG: hypothetical protein ACRD2X_11975 [Vicinamibacteraceae bacterium]